MQYRQPQGVGVWSARAQYGRGVDHDNDPVTPNYKAVETVSLTFLSYADLEAFMADLQAGSIAYMAGTSEDAEASLSAYDTWRVAQAYSEEEGGASVTYTNAGLRESFTIRNPVVTRNADGTGSVRDGDSDGALRTRYYGADFSVSNDGSFSGTLLRTLTTKGDRSNGAVVSRTDYPGGTFRQTRQRGADGVVVRENTQG